MDHSYMKEHTTARLTVGQVPQAYLVDLNGCSQSLISILLS